MTLESMTMEFAGWWRRSAKPTRRFLVAPLQPQLPRAIVPKQIPVPDVPLRCSSNGCTGRVPGFLRVFRGVNIGMGRNLAPDLHVSIRRVNQAGSDAVVALIYLPHDDEGHKP
jgi:hypothetical protein